jgi:methionyl-tRNA synthetase
MDKDQERAALERLGIAPDAKLAAPPKAAAKAKPSKHKQEPTVTDASTSTVDPTAASGTPATPAAEAEAGTITYDDFAKVELRVALVLEAEKVPKSDKLLKLSLEAGDGAPRQILAGIAQHYAPEALVGKRVIIVANLKPRKMMGLESQGMVLAASDDTGLFVSTVAGDVTPGSVVK